MQGVLRLYAGYEAHAWRNVAWNGTYFAVIHSASLHFPTPKEASMAENLMHKFATGFVGGTLGMCVVLLS